MAEPQARIVLSAVDRTSAAFKSAQRNLEALNKASAGISARFGSIGLAVAAAFDGISLKNAIDAGDELNKLSQKTGITVENLSGLKFAGQLADVSIEELAKGVKSLSVNMAAAAGGSKEQAAAFEAIGVKTKTADGALRNIDDVLADVADRFAGYEDGAAKAALAQDLFGKSGAALIPLLNAGSKGLADARKEAEALGLVFGKDLAEQSERFNDNLTRLGAAAQGAKIALANDLLPTLIAITEQLLEGRKAYGSFTAALLDIGFNVDPFKSLRENIVSAGTEIDEARRRLEEFKSAKESFNPFVRFNATLQTGAAENTVKDGEARLRFLKAQQAAEALLTPGARDPETNPRLRPPAKTQAPVAPKGTAPDQVALFKTQLQARLQTIQQTLSNEQDILRFNEQFIQEVYRSNNTSLESAFTAQDELRRRNVEEIRRASEATIQAEQDFQAKLPKPKEAAGRQRNEVEVEQSETRIAAARAKLQAAEREFDQATSLAAVQRPEQREQLSQQVQRFEAALQDMVTGGRARAGELADIAVQTREATRLLVEGGEDPAVAQQRAQQLGTLLEQQRQFALARDEFASITDRARDAEEALAIAQQTGGTGLLESERQLYALRTQELAQLDALIEKTRALAEANPANDQISDELRKLELAAARLRQVQDPTKLRFDAAADNIGDAIADGLQRAVVEGEKLSDIIRSLDRQIVAIVTQEVVTKPLAQSIAGFIKGTGGQGTGQNLITQLFGIGSSGAVPSGFSLGSVFGPGSAGASGLAGAGPLTGAGESGGIPNDAFGDIFGQAAKAVTDLGGAAGGASSVLGKLPEIAAIPASAALGSVASTAVGTDAALITLAAAADLAAQALLEVAAAGSTGGAAGLLGNVGSLFGGDGFFNDAGGLEVLGSLGFADGGYTGNAGAKEPAGVVHGKEFVFSAPAVQALGVDRLDLLHNAAKAGMLPGYEAGGYVDVLAFGLPSWSIDAAPLAPLDRALGLASASDDLDTVDTWARERLAEDPLADLERFHTGGLSSEEQLAVVLRNEEILTASDPRHSGNGGTGSEGRPINLTYNAAPGESRTTMLQNGRMLAALLVESQRNA
jgi:ribosomal protein L12E/L44/L45/RPP1/RPP2